MEKFIQYLKEKDLAKTTRDYYLLHVLRFMNWYQDDPVNCTKPDIINYLAYLKNTTGQSNITRRNALIGLNHYFTHLSKSNIISTNPTALIKIRGTKKKMLYTVFTPEQLKQLCDDYHHNFVRGFNENNSIKTNHRQSLLSKQRNYCMLTLLIYQGLATNELQKIQIEDLDLIKATVKITASKKANARTLPLNAAQMGIMIDYTQNIRPQFFDYCIKSDQLFLPLPTIAQKMTATTNLLGTVKSMSKQIRSLNNTFQNFHQIRASVITNWIKIQGLRKAQYLAGHRNISSTEEYKVNDLESLTEDIANYHPL